MLAYLATLSPPAFGFVVAILTAVYAYAYARHVLKTPARDANKVLFKTLFAGIAAAGTLALLARSAPEAPMPLTAEPFFAPL